MEVDCQYIISEYAPYLFMLPASLTVIDIFQIVTITNVAMHTRMIALPVHTITEQMSIVM